ncbi:MAG: glycosyltransferase family 39 protein, partial [Bacteroidota bacterium]
MRKYRWLALFILLAVALRWGSFFISVINHDESTYIVIADGMLRGEVYLRDVVDTKPIGIFWLYAALIKLTGGAIWGLRTAAALVVALGAWGLFLAGRRATGSEKVGVAAGVIYCWACAIFTYYGLSPNTEIFFNLFTIFAVALVVAPRVKERAADPFWHWPLAGLLLGLAMIVKPFAAAESLAVGLFLVWFYGRRGAYG